MNHILHLLFDLKALIEIVVKEAGVSLSVVNEVLNRYNGSMHKRSYPPMVRSW